MNDSEAEKAVKTTQRSLAIVDLVQEHDGCTLSELTETLGTAKSTVHKHLCTLEREGYLTKEGDTYHIGLKFHYRGEYARLRKRGYRLAGRAVQRVIERTDEEADFVVENDGRILTIHESYHPSNPYHEQYDSSVSGLSSSGTYYPMHCTAGGKALLAELPRERVDAIVDERGLPERTERTITTRRELRADLENVCERGYGITNQEFVEGLRAIGVAVKNPDGSLLGALTMSIPTYRRSERGVEEEASELLVEAAGDIEDELARADEE